MFATPEKDIAISDTVLQRISIDHAPFVFESTEDVFFDLVSMVLDQQIHYRSRQVYLKKLLHLVGGNELSPEVMLTLSKEDFANQKMALNKYETLIRLSEFWADNQLANFDWQEASDNEVRGTLLSVKGIGEWTVDTLLLFTLGRPDIFNPNDYQLKKAMIAAYGLANDRRLLSNMEQIAENWKPYRSTGVLTLLSTVHQSK